MLRRIPFALLLVLLTAQAAAAAIALDIAEEHNGQTVSPASFTSTGSVSASATVMVVFADFNATVATMATVTATWDGVSMTAIGTGVDIAGGTSIWMFALKSPASGTKVLSMSWTGGGNPQRYLGFVTFTGSDTAGAGFNGATSGTGSGTTINAVVTTTSGDMAVAGMGNTAGGIAVVAGTTSDWIDEALTPNAGEAHKPAVGASTTVAWTAGSSAWAYIGVNVQQPGAGGAATPQRTTTGAGT